MTKKLQKQPYRGFIFEFEPERASRMADLLSAGYEVSDSFSSDDWGLERKEIFLIVETDPTKKLKTLIGAVFVERMHGTGGTRKPKYRISRPVFFKPSVQFVDIEQAKLDVTKSVSEPTGGARLTVELWNSLIAYLRSARPDQEKQLDALILLVEKDTQLLGGTNRLNRLAEQRDAVGMVLDMAGIDRMDIFKEVDAAKAEGADDFLDLLTNYRRQERSLIEHDEQWLQAMLKDAGEEVVFSASGSSAKVSVRITDKEPLER